jgi:hypothetical protein
MMNDLFSRPIPTLTAVRWVPTRYQHILPLEVVKRHQCLVLGAARGVLTVAIADTRDRPLVAALEKFTGHRIFTVLIEPASMRILIERLERDCSRRGSRQKIVVRPCYLHRVQLRALVYFMSARVQ